MFFYSFCSNSFEFFLLPKFLRPSRCKNRNPAAGLSSIMKLIVFLGNDLVLPYKN